MSIPQKRVAIADATEQQLRDFAIQIMGISLDTKAKPAEIRSAIARVWTEPNIPVMVAPAPAEAPKGDAPLPPINHTAKASSKAMVDRTSGMDPKVRLVIHRQEGKGGDRDLPVSVNGATILIPRGKQVEVPYRYFLALKNAVQTIVEQDEITLEEIRRDVPSYPFEVASGGMPSQAEIDAWHVAINAATAA